ncbi:MAG: arginine--tRNA ligase [Candidatus Paceibacterota bacterium]|jgi:arginyl-tRNA synthetase
MIRQKIENKIAEILKGLGIAEPKVILDHPGELAHGDYASNVALMYAKELKMKPSVLAEKVLVELGKEVLPEVEKMEIAGPGFINFYLAGQYLKDNLSQIVSVGDKYGANNLLNGEKTVVEYTDPNPFKEFHIGHLMSNAIGESISRIVEANGAEVKRACYQGDVGLHVAKAIYGMAKNYENKKIIESDLLKFSVNDFVKLLGQWYATGATAYEEDEKAKISINEINKQVYERDNKLVNNYYDFGREWSLKYFETIYKRLGTFHNKKENKAFDFYFFESKTGEFGKKIVEENIGKVFEKSDGAIVFKAEQFDPKLHTRVFINSEGLPTYEAKELGLAKIKYDTYQYEKSIVVTGNEINDYFKVLLKAMEFVFPDLAEKTKHISHGMLRLPTGKMSSRTGKVISAETIINQLVDLVLKRIADRNFDIEQQKEISESVAISAIKYTILKQASGSDIVFDFDKSVSFEGDSGPYVQYTAVRAGALLEKGKVEGIVPKGEGDLGVGETVARILNKYPDIVERAGKEYAPHLIALYALELASAFNGFYGAGKIVDAGDKNSPIKLLLTASVKQVLTNALGLLGISVPERM